MLTSTRASATGNSTPLPFRNPRPASQWALAWNRFRRHRLGWLGLGLLGLILTGALAAPWLAGVEPDKIDSAARLLPPASPGHLLGTDDLGRDLWARLLYGARVSILMGVLVVALAAVLGVLLGAASGYLGGWVDQLIMRVVDVLFAFPFFMLAIAVVAVLGPGIFNAMLTLAVVSWIVYARLMRAQVLSLKEREYVESARAIGASHWRILTRHLLPNALPVIIVQASFGMGAALLSASGLSFLGLGVQPPTAEWGAMLRDGQSYLRDAPYIATFPGLAILLTTLSFNFAGDALRDALDPNTFYA